MKIKENINLAEMAYGALQEQFNNAFLKVIDNINDPNMVEGKTRKLTITMKVTPNRQGGVASIDFQTKVALQPVKEIRTEIAFGSQSGEMIIREYKPGIPAGQINIDELEGQKTKVSETKVRKISGGNK